MQLRVRCIRANFLIITHCTAVILIINNFGKLNLKIRVDLITFPFTSEKKNTLKGINLIINKLNHKCIYLKHFSRCLNLQ